MIRIVGGVALAPYLIVLDRDLFAIPREQISRARVLLTPLDGKDVYRDSAIR